MTIHDEHPFQSPPETRDLWRQLRGRLASPVTILTAGDDGMTASAVLMVDGDPPRVVVAISNLADFHDAVGSTKRFVMHIGREEHRAISDRFAEVSPSPGGLFHGLTTIQSEWGPRIDGFDTWAGCVVEDSSQVGYQNLIVAAVVHLEVGPLDDPLIYFRGRYRSLS